MEAKPIKVSFSVEFNVRSEDYVVEVLRKVNAVRQFVAQLGYVRIGDIKMHQETK